MDELRSYILRIIAAAVICGILTSLPIGKALTGAVLKLVCGVILLLCVISPILSIKLEAAGDLISDLRIQADAICREGEELSRSSRAEIIIRQTQAYILDKAEALGVQITVEVMLTEDDLLRPYAVRIEGTVSPHDKGILSKTIAEDLSISLEDQIWIG